MGFGSDEVFDALVFQVTLCSNTVKRYKLALVVDVDGVGREVSSLPIRARYQHFPCSPSSFPVHVPQASGAALHRAGWLQLQTRSIAQ